MIKTVKKNLVNISGWRTDRKILVIESDDWGSIRMPSKAIYQELLNKGIPIDNDPYCKYDSLASPEDLEKLFDVLISVKDKDGNPCVITANTVVANPDFDKIQQSDYRKYFYEPFTATLKKYQNQCNSFDLWQEGIKSNLFHPQFHGREHVNIPLWLNLLQQGNEPVLKAFELGLWGLGPDITRTGKLHIQASFDALQTFEIEQQHSIIVDGLELFERLFGYRSKSFIANNFIWDTSLNNTLAEKGVNIIQGMKYQKLPILQTSNRGLIRHSTGEINKLGQVHIVRNCEFEPSQNPKIDSVSYCLRDISNAFFWKKPAIISAHRLNFIGHLNEENRNKNLRSLKSLLSRIVDKWPDVTFMTSDQLGEHIIEKLRS
jgi:hypothetical protein